MLVVQGGPGTGKTAVALHRAAYLLYTHRDRLARRGVLVVGPNPTFLRYIGQVLPSLGETSVVLGTVGQLFPGLDARRAEPPEVAEVKGRAEMAGVIAAAVRDRQQVPRRPVELTVEQQRVRLDRDLVNAARTRARRSRRPHNEAKRVFHREAVRLLAEQVARGLAGRHRGLLDAGDLSDIRDELAESRALTRELDALWPTLTAERLLTDLFADRRRLDSVARRLPAADRELLARPAPAADVPADLRWTPADVPLLDEAAELLGDDGSEARAAGGGGAARGGALRPGRARRAGPRGGPRPGAAARHRPRRRRPAGRAAAGAPLRLHRRAGRRGPGVDLRPRDRRRGAGAVGDGVAAAHAPVPDPLDDDRRRHRPDRRPGRRGVVAGRAGPVRGEAVRLEQLTVNYRTPAEIAAVADDVLAEIDPTLEPPRSVRATGCRRGPWRRTGRLGDAVAAVVAEEAAAVGGAAEAPGQRTAHGNGDGARRTAGSPCWRPPPGSRSCGRGCCPAPPTAGRPAEPDLDAPVVVLPVSAAKGLEFDAVVLVEPAELLAESPRGRNDLYVALTRATQRLTVVHAAPLPPELRRLGG